MYFRITVLVLGLAAWVAAILVHVTPLRLLGAFKTFGYWFILANFLLFVWASIPGLRRLKDTWRRGIRSQWTWLLILLVAGLSVFLQVIDGHGFKLIADELDLMATSMQMHFHHLVEALTVGYPVQGDFVPLSGFIDKRPLFYPFVLSVLHGLIGYRPENAFVLNAIITPILLALTYFVGRRLSDRRGGVLAMLLLVSIPLVGNNVTGGGFAILNLVMILATILAAARFIEARTEANATFLAVSASLMAQVRYESGLFLVPITLCLLYGMWLERRIIFTWTMAVLPFLMVTIPWQWKVFKANPAMWQLNDKPGAHHVFGLSYFYKNVGHAVRFLFSGSGDFGNSVLVAIVGVFGFGFFILAGMKLVRSWRERTLDPVEAALYVMVAFLLGHGILMLCYFWGQFDDIIIGRLSLPFQLFLIFSFVYGAYPILQFRKVALALSAVAVLFIVVFTAPQDEQSQYYKDNFAAETVNWERGFIHRQTDHHYFVIDGLSAMVWGLYKIPCIVPQRLAARMDKFLFQYEHRTFSRFLVVQRLRVDLKTGKKSPLEKFDLGPGFVLKPVDGFTISPTYFVRISKIVSVDPNKAKAWAKSILAAEKKKKHTTTKTESTERKEDQAYAKEWMKNLP